MAFPLIPNGRFDEFPPRTLDLAPGLHLVEALADGGHIAIEKPGYLGPNDFAVRRLAANGATDETLSHVEILVEFGRAMEFDSVSCLRFAGFAFRVFGGTEPPARTRPVPGFQRAGDYVLKALKWIWAQEDVNHAIARGYQGRRMSGYRLEELLEGVELAEVLGRTEVKGGVPSPLQGINYKRVDRALVGREPPPSPRTNPGSH